MELTLKSLDKKQKICLSCSIFKITDKYIFIHKYIYLLNRFIEKNHKIYVVYSLN